MTVDIKERILKIFETGIYYHAILQKYKKQVENIDCLEKMIAQKFLPNQAELWDLINAFFAEHNPQKAQRYYFILVGKFAHPDIHSYVRIMKRELNLVVPLKILSKESRSYFSAELLLDKYFYIHRLTNGFTFFDESALAEVLNDLAQLESIRKYNILFINRISCEVDKRNGNVYVYYDDKKTSFRQALKWALAIIGKQDGLVTLSEVKNPIRLKQYAGILATFAFENKKKTLGTSKEHFFKELRAQHIYETEDGFADTRFISRAQEKIDEIKRIISQFYEVNKENIGRETFSVEKRPKVELLDNVEPHTELKSALSIYINYYAYLLANPDFFRKLHSLRVAIDTDLKSNCKKEEERNYHLSGILNGVKYCDDKDIDIIRSKYSEELAVFNLSSPGAQYLGYFFCDGLVPALSMLISFFAQLKRTCGDDFSHLTRENLFADKIGFDLKKSIVINRIMPQFNHFTLAGYGEGNPAKVIPMNNNEDVAENIQSALDLFDRQSLQLYLSHITLDHKLKKIEELLWGMYSHYEKEWSADKVTDDKCMQQIDAWYDSPISTSRFQQGKKVARALINTFMIPMKNEK